MLSFIVSPSVWQKQSMIHLFGIADMAQVPITVGVVLAPKVDL
jgi:hypothetical protein